MSVYYTFHCKLKGLAWIVINKLKKLDNDVEALTKTFENIQVKSCQTFWRLFLAEKRLG
jgi:hypothetical protein